MILSVYVANRYFSVSGFHLVPEFMLQGLNLQSKFNVSKQTSTK